MCIRDRYLRLAAVDASSWADEAHFLAVAAKALRQVLVDEYRRSHRAKRGGHAARYSLDTTLLGTRCAAFDPLEIDEALTRLGQEDARAADVVEMRFFGGMTNEQIARRLGVSEPTVGRDWRFARAWLQVRLGGGGEHG